jgi:hypothetical protein
MMPRTLRVLLFGFFRCFAVDSVSDAVIHLLSPSFLFPFPRVLASHPLPRTADTSFGTPTSLDAASGFSSFFCFDSWLGFLALQLLVRYLIPLFFIPFFIPLLVPWSPFTHLSELMEIGHATRRIGEPCHNANSDQSFIFWLATYSSLFPTMFSLPTCLVAMFWVSRVWLLLHVMETRGAQASACDSGMGVQKSLGCCFRHAASLFFVCSSGRWVL